MAEKADIVAEIEGLAVHCRPPLMSVDDRSKWLTDWIVDLKEFPIENIRMACNAWRRGQDRKFPMAGQLIPAINATIRRTSAEADKPQPWRPLADHEYRELSVREKIRHHQIMAHEAMGKGGPMYRQLGNHSEHLTPDQMPPAWHSGRSEAKFHHTEIRRLTEIIKSQQVTA